MNPEDPFEEQLRRLKPAAPPREFMERLAGKPSRFEVTEPQPLRGDWLRWLFGWPAYAAAAVIIAVIGFFAPRKPAPIVAAASTPPSAPRLEYDKTILRQFDGGIVELPGRHLVRLNCYLVGNEMRVKDQARGVVLEQSAPSLEVIPVSVTTY